MKKILSTFLIALGLLPNMASAQSQGEKDMTNSNNILVAYYSWSGNTQKAAEAIHQAVGGDIFAIKPQTAYPDNYDEIVKLVKQQNSEGFKPKLLENVADISKYDIIFIGSPNWWGTIAPVVSTFLADNNLSGKTVIPFITNGGGGKQNTLKDLTAQCTGCEVKEGWVGYGSNQSGLTEWLQSLGY